MVVELRPPRQIKRRPRLRVVMVNQTPPKPAATRRPHFMRQWRESHGFNLLQMTAKINALPHRAKALTSTYLGRVERGELEYRQSLIEAYCDVLGCTPGDLLSRAPRDPAEVYRLLIAELPGLEAELNAAAIARATQSLRPSRRPKTKKANGRKEKKPKG